MYVLLFWEAWNADVAGSRERSHGPGHRNNNINIILIVIPGLGLGRDRVGIETASNPAIRFHTECVPFSFPLFSKIPTTAMVKRRKQTKATDTKAGRRGSEMRR